MVPVQNIFLEVSDLMANYKESKRQGAEEAHNGNIILDCAPNSSFTNKPSPSD